MSTTKNKKLPFTLDSLKAEEHFVEIVPEWLTIMKDVLVEEGEESPAQKLYNSLEMKGVKCGLSLPKKHGLSIGERTLIKDAAASQNEAMLDWFMLAEKICTELGVTTQEVSELLQNPFQNIQKLRPFMREIVTTSTRLKSTQMDTATVTAILQQRKIENWEEKDTMALNSLLFDEIFSYCESEQNGWVELSQKSEVRSQKEMEGDDPLLALPSSETELGT